MSTPRNTLLTGLIALVALSGGTLSSTTALGASAEQGKELAFSRKKGNCLSCHAIEGGSSPGNFGPPLRNIQTRFANKSDLHKRVYDATAINPETSMPPFGRHKILSDQEIDHIVEFVWTL